jgi:hypothetical protein
MRGITVLKALPYIAVLLFLVGLSAMPSHAACATAAGFNTPYLVFGTQSVGTSGLTQTGILTFGNGCGTTVVVTITGITISGTNYSDFKAAGDGATPCNVGTVLTLTPTAETASCTLGGTFTPTATGTRTAAITVSYSVSGGLQFGPLPLNVVGGDEVVYVTTGVGGQVLTVDGTTGAFQILSNGPACGTPPCFNPTGAVVGPDGKIYVTDQINNNIWRMNQDASQLEAVYQGSGCPDSAPCEVEGPSFSDTGTGDLYFNTYYNNGIFVIPDVGTTAVGGPFNAPASVNTYAMGGTGTAFDTSGSLLASDVEYSTVWTIPPPYTASATEPAQLINSSTSAVGVQSPAGIALNKMSGQIFVADPLAQVNDGSIATILQVIPGSTNTTAAYYTFTSTNAGCESDDTPEPDLPEYIAFDMTGHLFATTSTSPISFGDAGSSGCGKVWRIDPTSPSPTATLLVDLYAAFTNGITNGDTTICNTPCGLKAGQAIGLAIGPTQGPTQMVALLPTGGTYAAGIPLGCTVTEEPGPLNTCIASITGVYPGGIYSTGDTMNITFYEMNQAQYTNKVLLTPYAMTMLATIPGWNGDGVATSLVCMNSSGALCDDTVTPGTSYEEFTTWQTDQLNYCNMLNAPPHLLRGDPPDDGPYTFLVDTLVPGSCTVFDEPGAGTKGKSSCTSSSSSSCASDWLNSTGPVTGSTAGVTATETITSPTPSASFLLNQPATATFACGQNPSSPSIVVACPGIVTQPSGTIASVASGGSLPTSQAGMYTLSVTAEVDGGSPGTGATAVYTVLPCQDVSIGVNPATIAAGNSTTVTATFQSCNSKTGIAVLQFALTGPFGKNCGTLTTPQLSVPVKLFAKPASFNFKLPIPGSACAGTYTVKANTLVNGTLVDTTSTSLVVTAP